MLVHVLYLKKLNREHLGVGRRNLLPVKRETGANPVRTRHRNKGADARYDHWETGKIVEAKNFESGDLPMCCTETSVSDHE